jgi:putative FmdB family regulatory protein
MPFYEYECEACRFYTEVMQKITDAPLTKCPSCGKRRLKKLVSAPVFRLKGAGWYETDFKSDKENRRNLSGPDKEEAKAESKPEAKDKAETKDKAEAKDAKPAEAKAPAAGKERPADKERAAAAAEGARRRAVARRPARPAASRAQPARRRKARR